MSSGAIVLSGARLGDPIGEGLGKDAKPGTAACSAVGGAKSCAEGMGSAQVAVDPGGAKACAGDSTWLSPASSVAGEDG